MSLLRAMSTVAGMTGLSRIAGFIRDILMASILGAGPIGDAFFVALKLPNFFRRVTAEGAFSVSFVPIYSKTLGEEGRKAADSFALNAFWLMSAILCVFCLLCVVAMPWVITAIAPGFLGDPERFDLTVEFSRITFFYLLLMSLTALLGGVLNALERFAPFAFAPVLFNLVLIVSLLISPWFASAGHALAWGILFAGFLQLGFMIYCTVRSGFRFSVFMPKINDKTKRVFTLMGPGVLGAGVMHINLFADLILASFLQDGAVSYLYYADRLNQLPLGVVGIAVGTALLPMLSKTLAAQEHDKARDLFNRALEYCFLLALPAAVALLVIPLPIIHTLFERGAFKAADTWATSGVLMAYASGLPAYIAIKVFSTAHWARQDTVTPVKIAIVATLSNVALSIVFIKFIGVAGIALATGLTGWLQFALHIRSLSGHPVAVFDARFKMNVIKITVSSILMGALLLGLYKFEIFPKAFNLHKMLSLIALISSGLIFYGISIFFSGVMSLSGLKRIYKK